VEVGRFHNSFADKDEDALLVQNRPGCILTPQDAAPRPLTTAEAQQVFEAMAAKGDRIAFRYLKEGCECRTQLMIEDMMVIGINPGRVWALCVPGKSLVVANPLNPRQPYKWGNHVAPVVAVDGQPYGVLVIDPSLSKTGPMTILEWTGAMKLSAYEMPAGPLSQVEMLALFSERTLKGSELQGFVYVLELGVSPVSDVPGSGFRIATDPPEGVSAFAHAEMQRLLAEQARRQAGGHP